MGAEVVKTSLLTTSAATPGPARCKVSSFVAFKIMVPVKSSKRELMLLISYNNNIKKKQTAAEVVVSSFVAFKIMVPVKSSKRELMLLISYNNNIKKNKQLRR